MDRLWKAWTRSEKDISKGPRERGCRTKVQGSYRIDSCDSKNNVVNWDLIMTDRVIHEQVLKNLTLFFVFCTLDGRVI